MATGIVRLQQRLEASADEVQTNLVLLRVLVIAFALGSLLLTHWLLPPVETVGDGVPAVVGAIGTALVAALSFTVTGMISLFLINRAFRPALAEVDGVELSDRTRRRNLQRWVVAPTLFGGILVLELSTADAVPYGTGILLVGGSLLGVGYYHLATRIDRRNVRTWNSVRDATADERALIERCYDRFGRTAGPSYVFDIDERSQPLIATNVPGDSDPSIWIEDAFLEELTETELTVMLAQADEQARAHASAYAHLFVGILVSGVLVVGWLLATVQSIPLAVVAAVLAVAGCSVANRRQEAATFRADDLASDHCGAETVRTVYNEYGHQFSGPLSVELSRRIERLEERIDEDNPAQSNSAPVGSDASAGSPDPDADTDSHPESDDD
ncbi:hypothetical protein [Natronolimnohabitans innermongolicus]|uniref:Peptidase n=1 Tax=Natronolimnohabitans innermongolicus JCM 12255 TaxID=1227499 RepID=L9WI56_9EURY|nr:hypothetical protein [Natronolimnohabitans innermongolicus]ELY49129.1 hypothetical protein C493_21076 [Natronolimnohabitans innermongolicus JCM 12255]